MDNNVRILVAAHKEYRMPDDPMYLPVQAGASGKDSIGFQRDDEGENISSLNPFFCELTCLYWGWKNLNTDYLGLAHYRRHFAAKARSKDPWKAVLKYEDIREDLGRIRVFVPAKRRYYIETLYSHYDHTHDARQLDETGRIIREKYPDYEDSFRKVCGQRWGYMFNMMIMESDLAGDYCAWLFDILFELRNRLGEEGLTPFQSRYYGRISEIIFNVWLDTQIRKRNVTRNEVRELPVLHMEKVDWRKKGTAFLKAKFRGHKYEGSF